MKLNSKPSGLGFKRQIPFHPWVYFFIFLAANLLLSYAPLPLRSKLWIGVLGVFLPFVIGFQTVFKERRSQLKHSPNFSAENRDFIQPWLWIPFITLLFLTRFYHLTSLPFWPISDEGINGFLGMELARQWNWRLLYSEVQVEPLGFWLLGLYFKVIDPSFFSLRLFPTLVSLATVFAAYWAARQYFSRSLAFLFAWLCAFSFWEFTLARLCIPVIWPPLLECLCLGLLGLWLKSKDSMVKWRSLTALILLSGAGFYIWTIWAGIWLGLTLILALQIFLEKKGDKKHFFIFCGTTFLLILPLLIARLSGGGTTHIREVFSFSIFKSFALYGTGVFWNGFFSFPFGSNWGGFFNPILDSLIFLGIIFLLRELSRRLLGTFMACLFLAALPGLLTSNVELYRILLTLPLLTLLAAIGAHGLMAYRPRLLHTAGILFLVAASFFLDVHNYISHYCDISLVPAGRQWRNVGYHHVYQILKTLYRQSGPFYVFSEFNNDYDNKTLNVACYPFDAVQNPALSASHPQWAVVIVNFQYAPYLIQNFPGLRFKLLKTDRIGPADSKPFGIFMIPTSQIPPARLDQWIQTDHIYREIDFEIKNKTTVETWAGFLESFSSLGNQSKGDRFLTAVYWEKMGFFKFLDAHVVQASEAYQNAISQGIPAAQLYYNLGVCLKIMNQGEEADKNFEKAQSLSMKAF